MGANTRESSNTEYYSIFQGKLSRKVNADTPGAVMRENKEGKKVYEIYVDSWTGFITDIVIETAEIQGKDVQFLKIKMQDVADKAIISFPVETRFFNSFCSKIKNVNLDEEVELKPYSFEENGKKISGINFFHGKNKVEPYFTRETPHNKPVYVAPVDKKTGQVKPFDKNSKEWKYYLIEEKEYYVGLINDFTEMFKTKKSAQINSSVSNIEAEGFDPGDEPTSLDDDLPF